MYQIIQDGAGFKCYGAAAEFWRSKEPEIMLSGGYETGKTMTNLHKIHALALKYPKSQILMVRKTYSSLVLSAVVTYRTKVLRQDPLEDPNSPITVHGGNAPKWFDYPNGSRIILGGLDNASKVLSAEYDFIYVNQAEELTLEEWEALAPRASGRAGNSPYAQIMGDCNPRSPSHWIVNRPSLKLFHSKHEDNPRLFDQKTKTWTEQGVKTIAILDNLSGVNYLRGRLGKWVASEGQVYENFLPSTHIIQEPIVIPPEWRRICAIDFGYTNPFVCLWLACDPDGRLYVYRQLYQTGLLVQDAAKIINDNSKDEFIEAYIADHDAEDRATLRANGIYTIAAQKDTRRGIQLVSNRLNIAPDGKPRLFILSDSLIKADNSLRDRYKPTNLADEFSSYVWSTNLSRSIKKELPVKEDDHALDALRYAVMYLDSGLIVGTPTNPFY